MPAPVHVALLWPLLAPTVSGDDDPAKQPTPPVTSEAPVVDDYIEQAPLDVETILTDSSRAYLHARARLESHPELAAEAILDRLTTVPPPTGTDRKRLLDVLAVLGLPDHVELFARELRRGVGRAESPSEATKAVDAWLPLIRAQGAAAVGPLTSLIADKSLPIGSRAAMLDALVDVTPQPRVSELVALLGRGARPLRQQLQRSLKRRAGQDPDVRQRLLTATDAALETPEVERVPALLRLRGSITPDGDTAFTGRLSAMAHDGTQPFTVRVASLRALAQLRSAAAHEALRDVAAQALAPPQAGTQQGEIVAWIALRGLPPAMARPLVDQYDLVSADAPRLAAVGLAASSLGADQLWLAPALGNPWPQVRKAALSRVEGPCVSGTLRLLEHRAHLAGRDSEDDRAVARGAVQALGRCSASGPLRGLLGDNALDVELRAEAARQLARLGDDTSVRAIGRTLNNAQDRILARRLASALRHMPKPTPAGDAILCEVATRADEAGHAARESLRQLHGDLDTVCR
ncbi:MAG: hypothetical protein K0V04_05175 [Deltaproteobacteria bacterium]|nr:hypothetical protein [Deltaproteobacteria bacterium]